MNRNYVTAIIVIILVIIAIILIMRYTGTSTPLPNNLSEEKSVTIDLDEQNSSDESGEATLTDVGGQTRVEITLDGASATSSQPAHIHIGSCPNPGAIKYPLVNVVNGRSETMLNISLAALLKQMPLAVNVHKSVAQSNIYVACGNLTGTTTSMQSGVNEISVGIETR